MVDTDALDADTDADALGMVDTDALDADTDADALDTDTDPLDMVDALDSLLHLLGEVINL